MTTRAIRLVLLTLAVSLFGSLGCASVQIPRRQAEFAGAFPRKLAKNLWAEVRGDRRMRGASGELTRKLGWVEMTIVRYHSPTYKKDVLEVTLTRTRDGSKVVVSAWHQDARGNKAAEEHASKMMDALLAALGRLQTAEQEGESGDGSVQVARAKQVSGR